MNAPRTGLIIVVSAPSGGGKSSLCQRLLNWSPNLIYSVSCTTRAPRGGEQNGRDYYFVTREDFEKRIAAIEGGTGALAVASGQSAITYALLAITQFRWRRPSSSKWSSPRMHQPRRW